MISRALNALGLVTRVEHERLCDERFESLEGMIDSRNETIETITADRDNWRAIARDRLLMVNNLSAGAEEWQAKFKLAATDLAKQAEEIAALGAERSELIDLAAGRLAMNQRLTVSMAHMETDRNMWREQALRDEHPANMWRNSLKRSRDRKKGVGRG